MSEATPQAPIGTIATIATIEPDGGVVEAIMLRRKELGGRFPRIAVFLFGCEDPAALAGTIARIPNAVVEWVSQLVVVPDRATDVAPLDPALLAGGRTLDVRVHRNPRDQGFGGARKAAFEYALRAGFDHVVVMRGDGVHPPEMLPELLQPVLTGDRSTVCASRLLHHLEALRTGMPLPRVLLHSLASAFQNAVLALRLQDYHSSYRIYSRTDLERVPFQLNENDRLFDVQIVIQLRALGVQVCEVPMRLGWREEDGEGLRHVLRVCGAAVGYRLHQLHVTRRGRYFVDRGIFYTLKHSETGSHMQIVSAIRPGSRVLDLGCSQGLLARPLREKNVRVTGVDEVRHERLAAELDEFYERDLDQPLELPVGRDFDYVVVSDVIEHLRNRRQLLRGARRFLKEGGRLIISTPNIALWFYRLSLLVGRFEYGARGVLDETHVHLFTRSTFRREVKMAGFHVLKERVTSLPFEVVFESTGRSRLLRAIARGYHGLARFWPELFAYQHILEAEITTLDEEAVSPDPERRG